MECLTTGSPTFDRILGGGIPARSVTVVAGEPGAGKTLFALQMLFHVAKQGKKALYVTTLSEPSMKLLSYAQQFSFFDPRLLESGVVFADLGSVIRGKGPEEAVTNVSACVERVEPALFVIDSFKAIRDILPGPRAARTFIYDLAVHTAGWGATSLFLGEYTEAEGTTLAEFAIADGILRFSNRREGLTATREVEVVKLRGADHVSGRHFFEISADGLAFYPRVRGPDSTGTAPVPLTERATTGLTGLDLMLGGGLPRAGTTVVQGGTGTGKTLLGLHFLLEGARRGEAGVHFTLEETPDQLRAIAHAFGWDLAPLEARGLLTLAYFSPVELSTDCFLDQARQLVDQQKARRVVLDSLTSMALGVPSERRFRELVYAMTKHFRAAGVTLSLNMETTELLGSAQLSGHGVSFAADNVIQLRYVELAGHLERSIVVLKARGVKHDSDAHKLSFTASGLEVGAAFEGLHGVLTGLPDLAHLPRS